MQPDALPDQSVASYATCAACGMPLNDSEQFRGDVCVGCEEAEDPHAWCGFAPDHDGPCPAHPSNSDASDEREQSNG